MDSEQVLRNATATWTADHVEEALEHPDPDVRQSMLVYALRDLSESDLHAIVRAAGEHIENRRSARRTAPAVVPITGGKARLFRRRDAGNVYNLYPYLPTGPGTGTPWVLVSHRDGQTTVSMCDHEGDVPSKPGVQERFVTVVTDEEALASLGYEVVLPTDQSHQPDKHPGIPGIPEFVAERERREANDASTATWMRNMDEFGTSALYRLNPPLVGVEWALAVRIKGVGAEGRFIVTASSPAGDVRNCVLVRDGALSHEDGWRKCGYTLVDPE